jgi:hypothetical protein
VEKIRQTVAAIHAGTYKSCGVPPCWDGKATERIFAVLNEQ